MQKKEQVSGAPSDNSQKKLITSTRLLQSALAGLFVFLLFLAVDYFQNNLAVTSLGASAFIAFCFPAAETSRPKYLIGGYCIGVAIGFLCSGLVILLKDSLAIPAYIPACSLAVFLTILLMNLSGLAHPPAAALAIAITVDSKPFAKGIAAIAGIVLLCVIKELLKKFLNPLSEKGVEEHENK